MAQPGTLQANPYRAPRALLDDGREEFQPVKVFAVAGRIGRARYIVYSIGLTMLIMFAAGLVSAVSGAAGVAVTIVAWIAALVLSIMLTIQRSHDFNMTGWFSLLALVPLVNLLFWFIPGTDGPNRFGARTPPNSLGVLIGVWIVPLFFIGGMIAAIALPAYVDYTKRVEQRR